MNFSVPLIALGIAAVWYYIRNGGMQPAFPRLTYSRPEPYKSTFPAPVITGAPSVGDSPTDALGPQGAVTNQPSAASAGVPAYTGLKRGFGTDVPGPTNTLQPFRSDGRDIFYLQNIARILQPYDPSGRSCSGACCGSKDSCQNGGGCPGPSRRGSRMGGAGSCVTAPSNSAPLTADRPILINRIPPAPAWNPTNPLTLAAQIQQIMAHSMSNPFNAYQWGEHLADESGGGVPAAPTYHM